MKKLFCVMLILCCVLASSFCAFATAEQPTLEVGAISSTDGKAKDDKACLRTVDFVDVADYGAVSIDEGYQLSVFIYDVDKTLLGFSGWLSEGKGFTTENLTLEYPLSAYYKLSIRKTNGGEMNIVEAFASGLTYYAVGQELPENAKGGVSDDLSFEDYIQLGSCQEGTIFDKKLFTFSFGGRGAVYDIITKKKIADISLGDNFMMMPNGNSICFGSTYFAKDDKYPLLYVNASNSYGRIPGGSDGLCYVYRILEQDGAFSAELVQVIKIGFAEDTKLWKSSENSGYRIANGNFVVDTDNNQLYAFVVRDKEKVTRFFKFDIPALDEGEQNFFYNCNTVTLNAEDIKEQFDTQYFNNMRGCEYINGKIVSAEGSGSSLYVASAIKVLDLKTKEVIKTYHPAAAGLESQPALIAADKESGEVYYAPQNGDLKKLTCIKIEPIKKANTGGNKAGIPWALIIVPVAVLGLLALLGVVIIRKKKMEAEE